MIKPEDTAYGNEKSAAQVIEDLRGENHRMRVVLEWVVMRTREHTHNHILSDINHEVTRILKGGAYGG